MLLWKTNWHKRCSRITWLLTNIIIQKIRVTKCYFWPNKFTLRRHSTGCNLGTCVILIQYYYYFPGEALDVMKLTEQYYIISTVLVRCVKAIKGLIGSDSSKSAIFCPEVDNAIWFTFLPGAKRLDVNHRYNT